MFLVMRTLMKARQNWCWRWWQTHRTYLNYISGIPEYRNNLRSQLLIKNNRDCLVGDWLRIMKTKMTAMMILSGKAFDRGLGTNTRVTIWAPTVILLVMKTLIMTRPRQRRQWWWSWVEKRLTEALVLRIDDQPLSAVARILLIGNLRIFRNLPTYKWPGKAIFDGIDKNWQGGASW